MCGLLKLVEGKQWRILQALLCLREFIRQWYIHFVSPWKVKKKKKWTILIYYVFNQVCIQTVQTIITWYDKKNVPAHCIDYEYEDNAVILA